MGAEAFALASIFALALASFLARCSARSASFLARLAAFSWRRASSAAVLAVFVA